MNHDNADLNNASEDSVLEIRSLSIVHDHGRLQKALVEDVSFSIFPGEMVCVVGESGSGKSLTSLAIMGLLQKNSLKAGSGEILICGEDVLKAAEGRLRAMRASTMGMIFQEPMTALNPVQRVGEQIDEVLRIHGRWNKQERRAKIFEMLESVHLPEPGRIYNSYPHQLSGGQRQRVVICIALILKPKLLIADEPTTALDVTTQKQILMLVRELQEKHNTAVLFITHDFGVVAEIADRIVVMKSGRVVESGSRSDILARPRHPYSRMLVSAVPSLVPIQRTANEEAIVLDVRGLKKTYLEKGLFRAARSVAAADDINFVLRRGEILGIVGESGSGKSTVARCIARLIDPSAGSIEVQGEDVVVAKREALRMARKHIQIVFQDPYRSLNPRIRVGDSIVEGLLNFGTSRNVAMTKARDLLEIVGLDASALNRYPHQFSGGQRQRICIARALALDPQILIADEAVSALDVSVQAQVLALLEEIRTRIGIAVLFITHDLRVAAQICDTLIVMNHGTVVEVGPAQQVLTNPRHDYTKRLIESAPGRHWDFQNFRELPNIPSDQPRAH